ncbi:MAG: XshC-Cox1 family protein [Chloroflexi bacterium]|nr:XshC-Cox1 family protein [Chloroflexota bacterium]
MRDIVKDVNRWLQEGKQVAVATVVQVYGSALRGVGSKMACSSAGDISGSVSGGCIEGAVYAAAQASMQTGQPCLLEYGIANEEAWEIGLACGGTIKVWVESLDAPVYTILEENLEAGQLLALATILDGPGKGRKKLFWPDGRTQGDLGLPGVEEMILPRVDTCLENLESKLEQFPMPEQAEMRLFIEVFPPLPRLIVVGAVHIAIPLVAFAKILGYTTIVIDARSAFATRERFPAVDRLIVQWPSEALANLALDPGACVVIMTHDDKFDIPALQVALNSPARYIGILGSATTHARRMQELKTLGVSEDQLQRIHAPVGLDLGAFGAEEIALSIISEVTAVRHGHAHGVVLPMSAR